MVDRRDPSALGTALLALPRRGRLSSRYDRNRTALARVARHSANPSCIEKYGDPRERGDAWVEVHA